MKTEQAQKEFKHYREQHLARVTRDKDTFTKWYDRAAQMVFSGKTKVETIDAIAPCGCDSTQSNGVVAGAGQAQRLLKSE